MAREVENVYTELSPLELMNIAGTKADRRSRHGLRHEAGEILDLLCIGFMIGGTSYRGIYDKLQKADQAALLRILPLPHGLPHYSTYSRTLAPMDQECLAYEIADFLYQLADHKEGAPEHIAIDGKAIRAALNKTVSGSNLYIINIFNASTQLFLYQMRVGPKSQEGKVIEENIESILCGIPSVVTMDAMGTKKAILDIICNSHNNAVLPLKGNNKLLTENVRNFIIEHAKLDNGDVEHLLDLDGHSEDEVPSAYIDNTQATLYEEDNRKEHPEEGRPINEFTFFDNTYNYKIVSPENQDLHFEETDKKSKVVQVLIGNHWVTMVKTHGRFERREYELITNKELFADARINSVYDGWDNIVQVGMATRYRGVWRHRKGGGQYLQVSVTRTPYLMTQYYSIDEFANYVRGHWSVETFHNVVDKVLDEDHCTARSGFAPENCSLIRKLCYDLLQVLRAQTATHDDETKAETTPFRKVISDCASHLQDLCDFMANRVRSPFIA